MGLIDAGLEDRLLLKVGRCLARPANIQGSHLDAHDLLGTIHDVKIGSVPVGGERVEI
jgi:hypothetical protein